MRFDSNVTVKLIRSSCSDQDVVQAARVSYVGQNTPEKESDGLIRFLMRNRHGSPFEHNSMTFYIEAPIFVFREFHRHRIGWSYNEESARYKEMDPVFYIPGPERKLMQAGKPGAYTLMSGSEAQHELVNVEMISAYRAAFQSYRRMLDGGIAREVARDVLPVSLYSSMYATCNARSLMAFLSLRVDDPTAVYPSKPLAEIQMVADKMEELWKAEMPLTASAFQAMGRMSP